MQRRTTLETSGAAASRASVKRTSGGAAARCVVAGAALAACAYQPGSFDYARDSFPGERATVGCLDVAVARRADLPIGPVLAFQFANRCDHLLAVDLGALAVIGHAADGSSRPLAPFDPGHEIRAVALDARTVGREAIAYPADHALVEVCVDVTTFAGRGAPAWRCFASSGPFAASPVMPRPARRSPAPTAWGDASSSAEPPPDPDPDPDRSSFAVPITVRRAP